MNVIVKYLHRRDYDYKTNKGLAERQVRKYFVKKGYEVWRGNHIAWQGNNLKEYHADKLERLENLLKKHVGLSGIVKLSLYARSNAGLPDFIVSKAKSFFFVEVKLENEQLRKNQKDTITFIKNLGLDVIVIRLSSNKKVYEKILDLETGRSKPKSYIPRLKLKWRK